MSVLIKGSIMPLMCEECPCYDCDDYSCKATGYEHFINKDYTFEDIGKRLFLTREEAERALKERAAK